MGVVAIASERWISSPSRDANEAREIAVAGLLVALVWWLVTHPYRGIYHDGIVYSALALHWLNPDAFARDPFFSFGAQDRFSIFSPLFGALISWIGLSSASKVVVLAGGCAWLGGVWRLAVAVLPDRRAAVLALLCCAIYSPNYSPQEATFVLNETFATARLFSAPVSLWALALVVERRYRQAVWTSMLATLLHPLIGIWALMIGVLAWLPERLAAILVPSSFLLLFAIAASGQVPALLPMAQDWAWFVESSTHDVFAGGTAFRLNDHLFWLGVVLTGSFWLPRPFARLCLWVALVVAANLFLSLVCSSFYPIDLIIQVQPWRACWVAISVGMLVLVGLAWHVARERTSLLPAITIALLINSFDRSSGYILLAFWGFGHLLGKERIKRFVGIARRYDRFAIPALVVAVATSLPAYMTGVEFWGDGLQRFGWNDSSFWRGLAAGGGYALGPLLAAIGLGNRNIRRGLVAGAMVLAIPVASGWDGRTAALRSWEERLDPLGRTAASLGISPGQVVYWPGQTQSLWFDYGVASYVGSLQMIGMVFSRPRAEELMRRWRRTAVAEEASAPVANEDDVQHYLQRYREKHGDNPSDPEKGTTYRPEKITRYGLLHLCEDPELDWVIVQKPFADAISIPPQFRTAETSGYACDIVQPMRGKTA